MQNHSQNLRLVYVTCADEAEAKKIAQAAVESQLAACVNILANILSVYRWKSQTETSGETLLIIKTRLDLVNSLKELVLRHHSYECPEFIETSIIGGDSRYLDWWAGSLKD